MGIGTIVNAVFAFTFGSLCFMGFLYFDFAEKIGNKKTYPIRGWRFVMVRYTKKIAETREEEEKTKSPDKPKDPAVASRISRLAFWMQVVHYIHVAVFIAMGILYDSLQIKAFGIISVVMRVIFFTMWAVLTSVAMIYWGKMMTKRYGKNQNNK